MPNCRDCDQPVLTSHVTDEDGNEYHLRCLDPTEMDHLAPSDIKC